MSGKVLVIIFTLLAMVHCDNHDNDNSVEVCTTLTVPNYNTRKCTEDNIKEILAEMEGKILEKVERKMVSFEEKIDQVLSTMENITDLKYEIRDNIPHMAYKKIDSCDKIQTLFPENSPSGLYNITNCDGHHHTVYCSMENTCGDAKGGWMRVGYLNMSDPSEQCPPGFRLYEENGVRACGRQSSGCQSVKFPSHSISYSQVCGRVTGYQKGSPDAIDRQINDINQVYVDGVSITRGNPQQHVWTFMAALHENSFLSTGVHECPCAPNSPVTPQSFIGNDYFCESGNPNHYDQTTFHTNDPLWDGKQCGLIEKACCNVTGIPWFNKVLEQPTTDYIELRACYDQPSWDEVSLVGAYEIYVK